MFRVENLKLTEVLQDIGGEGYYIEPRSPDGRARVTTSESSGSTSLIVKHRCWHPKAPSSGTA